MTAEYRFVYFSPDPFIGSKIPVAALLRTSHGVSAVAPSKPLNPACLGGSDVDFLLRAAFRNLETASDLNQLPFSLGPHFTLASNVRMVPSKIEDATAWLASMLAPQTPTVSRQKKAPRVATEGRQFLQRYGVSQYVADRFKPKANVLSKFAERLETITHYVLGRELLLLEPIPFAASKERIIQINTRFGAYRQALREQPPEFPCALISYVLPPKGEKESPGGLEGRVAFADAIMDTRDPAQRQTFVDRIQHAATAG